MSIYDFVMLAVFAGAILFGLWKGLAWQVASLAAIFVSYFVAMQFRGQLAPFFKTDPPWNVFGAMLTLYLGTSLVIWVAFGYVRRTIERWHLKEFDRQAGALLGALKGALLCMVITMFAVTVSGERVRSAVVTSRSGNFLARSINQLSAVVPKEIHQILDPVLNSFNEKVNQPPTFPVSTDPGQTSGWDWNLTRNPDEVRGQFNLPPRSSAGQTAPDGRGGFTGFDPQRTLEAARELIKAGLDRNQK